MKLFLFGGAGRRETRRAEKIERKRSEIIAIGKNALTAGSMGLQEDFAAHVRELLDYHEKHPEEQVIEKTREPSDAYSHGYNRRVLWYALVNARMTGDPSKSNSRANSRRP